jgi:hypothetical protein
VRVTRRHTELVDRFVRWASAAHRTAVARHSNGDLFGERLATARRDVYVLAAALARSTEPDRLAEVFRRNELAHHDNPDAIPLAAVDDASVRHAKALAWQLCALAVDPGHQCIEQPW